MLNYQRVNRIFSNHVLVTMAKLLGGFNPSEKY